MAYGEAEYQGPSVPILDHGYVRLVESWGSDERIIEAARMSTGKGFLGWGPLCSVDRCGLHMSYDDHEACLVCPEHGVKTGESKLGDEKLLRFLYENKHATPFEMAGCIIEVKAPIFVFREWHRHRVPFSYNEMSARYTPLPDENYVPTVERLMINSKTNKQAGTIAGASELTEDEAFGYIASLRDMYMYQEGLYQIALKMGVPKELARIHLPVGRYSRMRTSSNLRGWLNFLQLRSATNPGAQYEIRQYGDALHTVLSSLFPRTLTLYSELQRAP